MALAAYSVPIFESERGWGSKIDDYMICLTLSTAKAWATDFNSFNTEPTASDWYQVALDGDIQLIEVTEAQLKALEAEVNQRMWKSSLKEIK
jgi:hypothetical protein